jgi:hypothetical protein
MKKILIILGILLLFMNTVHAGSIVYLKNFTNQSYQTADLYEGDSLLFNYKGGRHAIIFDNFEENNSVSITIFVFQNSYGNITKNQSAMFVTLKPGIKLSLDFDRDRTPDIDIKYLRQIFGKATLQVETLNLSDAEIIHNDKITNNNETNESNNKPTEKTNSNTAIGISIIIGIIIVGMLIYWVFTKKKNPAKTQETKKEETK